MVFEGGGREEEGRGGGKEWRGGKRGRGVGEGRRRGVEEVIDGGGRERERGSCTCEKRL